MSILCRALVLKLYWVSAALWRRGYAGDDLERNTDARMGRTRGRALPAGLIERPGFNGWSRPGAFWRVALVVGVNLLTGFLVLMAAFLYVLVYTPLKRITWLNTTFGAIRGPFHRWLVGPQPPARLTLGVGAFRDSICVATSALLCHRVDIPRRLPRRGFQDVAGGEPSGLRTFRQTLVYSVLFIVVSLLPSVIGMTGRFYSCGRC